jgi:hypothetical protein
MTHEWKPGDRAMVIVDRIVPHGFKGVVALKSENGVTAGVWIEALYPLPTPDPITELERAVVNKMMAWRDIYYSDAVVPYPQYVAARDEAIWAGDALCAALHAARTPVDPMTALRNAWEAPRGLLWAEEVQAALDAAEAAWKESKT